MDGAFLSSPYPLMNWQDLVKTAVVGTARQTLKLKLPENQLGELLQRLDSSDADTLLGAAGAISLYQKAGQLPSKYKHIPAKPCEVADLPICSQRAGQHLGLMLAGEYAAILPQWLEMARQSGIRVPPRYLADLLALGVKRSYLRAAILPVLGQRGLWLAAQNPDWSYAVSENTDSAWKKGSLEQRVVCLKKLREQDAQAARELLEQSWQKAKAQERASLLAVLETNLSISDEPFLEDALTNKSKQVRDVAVQLLKKLPSAKLVGRMIELVVPLVAFDQEVEITLPPDYTPEMIRDGIDESKYIPALGEKASLLLQMLSYVPPQVWCDAWGKTPGELVQIIAGSKWERLWIESWAIATINNQDKAWAAALLSMHGNFSYLSNGGDLIKQLLKILPDSQVQELILQTLLQFPDALNNKNPAFVLLINTEHIWSQEVSLQVLSSIRSYINANEQVNNWHLNSVLAKFGLLMQPTVADRATEVLSLLSETQGMREGVDKFVAMLQFRFEVAQALNS